MNHHNQPESATYEIRVKGHLGCRSARIFEGFDVTAGFHNDGTPVSVLAGDVPDQAALHGTLERIRDLGLEIVSVTQVDRGTWHPGPGS